MNLFFVPYYCALVLVNYAICGAFPVTKVYFTKNVGGTVSLQLCMEYMFFLRWKSCFMINIMHSAKGFHSKSACAYKVFTKDEVRVKS